MARFDPDRRAALRTLATGAIGTAAAATWVDTLAALADVQAHAHDAQTARAAKDWKPGALTAWQNDAVIALTELIIPRTDTPGAKDAAVNRFVDGVLQEASGADRDAFFNGLAWVDSRSKALFGKDIVSASAAEQTTLLTRLASEKPDEAGRIGADFFRALKSMTIAGYYSTEIGLRQELGDDGQLFLPEFKGCDHPEHL